MKINWNPWKKKTNQPFLLRHPYVSDAEAGKVSTKAFDEIMELAFPKDRAIYDFFCHKVDWSETSPWRKWEIQKSADGIVGSWTKRFSKFYNRATGKSIDPKDLSIYGEIIKRHTNRSGLIFSITDECDWTKGDFGDGHACFLFGTKGKRTADFLLNHEGAYAIKVHRTQEQFQKNIGIARSWFFVEDGIWYITNAYGMPIEPMVAMVAHEFKLQFHRLGWGLELDISYLNADGYILAPTIGQPYPTNHKIKLKGKEKKEWK
jgi:hypothetical protein